MTSWKRDHDDALPRVMAEQTAFATKLLFSVAKLNVQNLQIQRMNVKILFDEIGALYYIL